MSSTATTGGERVDTSNEAKSFKSVDPVIAYTVEHSLRLHPLQQRLQDRTRSQFEPSVADWLGAPEVLQLCANLIRAIHGRRCLDVGLFTGASALAWALALPDDGEVHSMDVTDEHYTKVGQDIIESEPAVARRIHKHIAPALQTLDEFIARGESGSFDFAFIDADKPNYGKYYERCLALLRPGGIIAVDNSLGFGNLGRVSEAAVAGSVSLSAIHNLNRHIHEDTRVHCSLLTTGDGLMLAFKN